MGSFLGFSSFAEFSTYATFVLLGMSIMMVVSAITSAPDFVTEYYRFATGKPDLKPEKPLFWKNVNSYYNVGTYVTQVICEPLALAPFMRAVPIRPRLILALCIPLLELLLLIIIPAIKIPTQDGAIAVLMVVSVLGGFSKALCNSCTNALAGPFPTKFMNGAQWGLGVSALFMSIVQIILKASMSTSFQSQLVQSRIYLGIAMGVQALALALFLLMYRNPFAQEYIAEFRYMAAKIADKENHPENDGTGEPNSPRFSIQNGEEGSEKHDVEQGAIIDPLSEERGQETEGTVLTLRGDADNTKDADQVEDITSSQQMLNTRLFPVFRKVWPMLFCDFFIFFLSLFLFPGLFFQAGSPDGWYFTIIVLLFNVGDFLSRTVLMIRALRPEPWVVVFGTFARLIIIPFLVLCIRRIIRGVWLPYVLITLLGFTNGYFGIMAMIHSPRTRALSTAGERSLAAILSGVFLMAGLCLGSNFALVLNLHI